MKLEDVKIGMRVRLTDESRMNNPEIPPTGTVMAFNSGQDVYGLVFPVDVKFDGVDYDLPVFKMKGGKQVYDMVNPKEIEPLEEGSE